MKILCVSDIHINHKSVIDIKLKKIRDLYKSEKPDVIVISGDIMEANIVYKLNPYKILSEITHNKIPIICVLGNHEFVGHTVESVLNKYEKKYNPELYNVHYLDIVGHYDIGDIRFLGNVLWYDGSMKQFSEQNIYDFAGGRWLDIKIKDFNYIKENKACETQIREHINNNKTNVLVTHTLPHEDLNGHEDSILSAFSGMKNMLEYLNVQYSISGHTHKRVVGKTLEDCHCVNVGNDYCGNFEYHILEI